MTNHDTTTSRYGYNTIPDAARAYVSGDGVGSQNSHHPNQYHQQQQQQQRHTANCHPNSPYYPRCLSYGGSTHDPYNNYNHHHHYDQSHHRSRQFRNTFSNSIPDMRSYNDHRTGDEDETGAIVPFYHPDYGYQYIPPDHFYTINTDWNNDYRRRKRFKKYLRLVASWLLPTVVAAIFVTSFEVGRRKKAKKQTESDSRVAVSDGNHISTPVEEGLIQVDENVILGHGGHGTVVYKGMLEGRQVAVKRMLKTYNASAEREISLLIESDGHPNVVRYHLKEARGDFVYLALELCDLSLHDLIGHIRARLDRINLEDGVEQKMIFQATKSILLQITRGAEHLHRLRIVHRDLKPANILLASTKTHKSSKTDQTHNSICENFEQGEYVAKISDMGLGKQLVGQSSYGGASLYNESSLRGASTGAQSSIIGIGPGSVGWQAPEVMKLRIPSDFSAKSDDSNNINNSGSEFSPLDVPSNNRTSRSVDIFSLGCVYYSTLIPGSHPFGDWYEREANIMHNRPNLKPLELLSLEAHDLISRMLQRDPLLRPTAKQIGDHPFFWTPDRRLSLLCDLSDRLEQDSVNATALDDGSFNSKLLAVEKNAIKVVGTSWERVLDSELISNVQKFRSYDPSSVRDLLRLIRNKYHHFDELPESFKTSIGSKPVDLSQYFDGKFPRLLLHAYYVCQAVYASDDVFCTKYSIFPVKSQRVVTTVSNDSSFLGKYNLGAMNTNADPQGRVTDTDKNDLNDSIESGPITVEEQMSTPKQIHQKTDVSLASIPEDTETITPAPSVVTSPAAVEAVVDVDDDDVIVWFGSTTAKTFQCRGWNRSDDEWQHQSEMITRRRDIHLVRCVEDPKYRTRLCNHWDVSYGTSCPMKKKNKCIFAHGPVELRVKETKRHRWGKLVDENGDCNNVRSSGGEDTYGAARSVEAERKQEGKWNNTGNSSSSNNNKNNNKPTGHGTKTKVGATTKNKASDKKEATAN